MAAKKLLEKLKSQETDRVQKRTRLFMETFGLEGEVAESYVEQILTREKNLYSRFLEIFLGKDMTALTKINEQVEALIDSCCVAVSELKESKPVETDTPDMTQLGEEVQQLMMENHELKKENEKLSTEANDLRAEMQQIMTEYVSIYGKNDSPDM